MPCLKCVPEDFVVEEVSIIPELKPGQYHYLYLSKKTFTTLKACQMIANFLHIPFSAVGFAGNKDKRAVTKQLISIKAMRDMRPLLERFKIGDITLEYAGTGEEPVVLGNLHGNRFTIVVRRIVGEQSRPLKRFVNFFGKQRFSRNNILIGKFLVQQKFKETIELINDDEVKAYLNEHPSNAVDALRQIPKQLLKMYVHAYQSILFNRTVKEFLTGKDVNKIQNVPIPLVGFGYECNNPEIVAIIKKLLAEEDVTERSFIIRPLPDISCEGSQRMLFADIHDLEISPIENDDLHPRMKKCTLKFWLDKGCYATVAVRQMFAKS